MPKNWWFDNQDRNNLRGVEDDPSNRPILPDAMIIEFLLQNPNARRDFRIIVPLMLPDEQTRLNGIVARNPRVLSAEPNLDPGIIEDRFQASQNRPGFRDPNRRRK